MELIDRNELLSEIRPVSEFDEKWACTGRTVKELMIEHINRAPTVDAVPIEELRELVNKLYEEDAITFRVLADINQLIGKHVRRKEQG